MSFAIGIENVKHGVNLGTLLRSAYNLGASLVFTVGRRYERQHSDTVKAYRHIPLLHFIDWDDYKRHAPFDWIPIAVEVSLNAVDLRDFVHPKSASYLLGPEDGSLSREAMALAKIIVTIPSRLCLNVSVAGSLVMYDRCLKEKNKRTN